MKTASTSSCDSPAVVRFKVGNIDGARDAINRVLTNVVQPLTDEQRAAWSDALATLEDSTPSSRKPHLAELRDLLRPSAGSEQPSQPDSQAVTADRSQAEQSTVTEDRIEVTTEARSTATFEDVAAAAVSKSTAETLVVADPIDVTTGRMILTHTDLILPGLKLERTYRSDYRWGRSFGNSWASTLDQRIVIDGNQARYLAPDGSILTYPLPAEGDTALPEIGRAAELLRLIGGGWMLTDPATGQTLLFAPTDSNESPISDLTDGTTRWTVDRDADGFVTSLRSSAGGTVTFTTADRLVTDVRLPDIDAATLTAVRFGYDDDRQLTEVYNSSGDPERFTYTGGRITAWEDRNNEWYTYTDDQDGRCIATDGRDEVLTYNFDYQTDRTVVTNSLGAVRIYELNNLLQVTAETDPYGAVTRREWDNAYRLLSETDPLGRTTRYRYDNQGRPTATIRPDGSRAGIIYDTSGRAVSFTDYDGTTRTRQYNDQGLLIAETGADGTVLHSQNITDQANLVATTMGPVALTRNSVSQITSMTNGDTRTTTFDFDLPGRVTGMQDNTGYTVFGWTPEGDMSWRENPDGTIEEFYYDGEGNLVEWNDPQGRRTYREYGAFDLVTAEIDHNGNRTEYQYDTELRLVGIINPTGQTWDYEYDDNGRLIAQRDYDHRTQFYAYDPAGQLTEHTNTAGETTTYTYDQLGQLGRRGGRSGRHHQRERSSWIWQTPSIVPTRHRTRSNWRVNRWSCSTRRTRPSTSGAGSSPSTPCRQWRRATSWTAWRPDRSSCPRTAPSPWIAPSSPPVERWLNEYATREGLPPVLVPAMPDPFA